MKQIHRIIVLLLTAHSLVYASHEYRQEFKTFKYESEYAKIFDHEIPVGVRGLYQAIDNYKELGFLNRLLYQAFFSLGVVIIVPEACPKLHGFIDSLCQKSNIKTPIVFVTVKKHFFNAAAAKLLMSIGGIVIGQQMLLELSDQELEGVIAHEIGHIKYNHVNKTILLSLLTYIATSLTLDAIFPLRVVPGKQNLLPIKRALDAYLLSNVITACIINKSFEKQADAFAYKENDYGQGLMEAFELLQEKEKKSDQEYHNVYAHLQKYQDKICLLDYVLLRIDYLFNLLGHKIDKMYRWIYHNTPLGAHPSHEERIATIKAYLENQ
jgi:Zn-dependent protease with chaperone function